jgi:hypothetical protein
VTIQLQYQTVKNTDFTFDQIEEGKVHLVQLGICPATHAKEVAERAMECLKATYYDKNIPEASVLWNAFLTFAVQESQSMKKKSDQNFGLSKTEFEQMAAALRTGDKSMFEYVFLAHFADCRRYICKTHGASLEDAYDATMDALMDFHHLIAENKVQYGNLRYLFTKMAGQRYQKSRRAWNEVQNIPAEALMSESSAAHESDAILEKAWKELCEECRNITTIKKI